MDSDEENLFGSSDEEGSETNPVTQLCIAVVTQCKRQSSGHPNSWLPHVLCITAEDASVCTVTELRETLSAIATLTFVTPSQLVGHNAEIYYDACVLVPPLELGHVHTCDLDTLLVPGGVLMFTAAEAAQDAAEQLPPSQWLRPTNITMGGPAVTAVKTVRQVVNTVAGAGHVDIDTEEKLLAQCVVQLSCTERHTGKLSHEAHQHAVKALREYGLCVVQSFFPAGLIADGGAAVVADVQEALEACDSIGIEPADADSSSYPAIVRAHDDKFTLHRGSQLEAFAEEYESILSHNPSLVAVLEDASLPSETTSDQALLKEAKTLSMLRRSTSLLESQPLGGVVSLPGDASTQDQLLHVDTEHLYEHMHLPPHYLVMFLPALRASVAKDESIGQTTFVAGSHRSCVAKHVTAGGVEVAHQNRYSATATQLDKRVGVVRPHCRAGDVILFDARILHFGVANQNADTMRPLLFVNYNRPWFSDYQPGAEVIVRHR